MRHSDREQFNNCPQAYRYRQDGLVKVEESASSNHAGWGSAIHKGLESHYKGANAKDAFLADYPENIDEDDLAKNKESGIVVLEAYAKHYATIDQMWEVLSTEELGQVEIGGENHDLHIDLVARHRQSGEIYLWDHKTTEKRASPTYWRSFELSAQLTRYCVFVKEKYGQCSGAIINNISVGHRKRAYKGEPAGFHFAFERQMFNRTPQQIAFWKESEEGWMKLIGFCEKEQVWPKALGKLCAWCSYYELCLASGDEQIKELMYETKKEVKA